jgi:hypothetical protein
MSLFDIGFIHITTVAGDQNGLTTGNQETGYIRVPPGSWRLSVEGFSNTKVPEVSTPNGT